MNYLVGAGDTPSKIAAGLSGHAARMPELLAANPHKPRVGGTFASLAIGEKLRVPAGWQNRVRQAAGMSGPPTGDETVGLGACCDSCADGGDCGDKTHGILPPAITDVTAGQIGGTRRTGTIGAVTGTADVNVQNVITQNVADAGNALLAALSNFNGVADCTNPTILGAVGAFQDAANASGLSQAVLGHSLTKDCNYGPQGAAVLGSLVVNAALAGITMTSGSAPDPLFVTGPCKMFVGCSGNVVNPTPNPPLPPSPPNVTPIINNNTAPSSNTALIVGGLALAAAAVGGVVYMSKKKKGGRRRSLRA